MSEFAISSGSPDANAAAIVPAIHLLTPTADESGDRAALEEFRTRISSHPLYEKHLDWITEIQLQRFLIARSYKVQDAYKLMSEALEWREKRQPSLIDTLSGWDVKMSREGETGKIYVPGNDKWGRSIVIFDNSVQNTSNVDDQMTFLAWNLEFATKLSKPGVDKYLVFMHMEKFSLFNMPGFSSTRETIHMLCNCYPERLGHCVIYQAPSVFEMVFNSVRFLIDEKTVKKLVFISGDVSDGSENDLQMRRLIGDDWKALTGAGQPELKPRSSPGFDHEVYWPFTMQRVRDLQKKSSGDFNLI